MERRPSRVSFTTTAPYDSARGRMALNFPAALTQTALMRLRPIFDLMCRYSYVANNENAIRVTDAEINALLKELKDAWDKACIEYMAKWRAGRAPYIKQANKELTENVQRAKRAYERMKKVRKAFDEAMEKHACRRALGE